MVFADAPSCSAPHSSCKTTRGNATPADCASDLVGCYPYCLDGDAAPVTIRADKSSTVYVVDGADLNEHYRQSQAAERMGRDYMAYRLEQVKPTATTTVTLVDKGGGEWLYLENGDPHPLRATDSTITIQRMGILYTFSRADSLYNDWGADIRDIFDRATDSPETENTRYMLSAREHP
ncbi:MAG: hypothetical protein IJ607_09030 [Bacteroidaceae bacterium]|nr:hypothetical protein [Bacteroidaceae bacterium]